MTEFITLISFSYPSELIAPRGLLESEGIACFVKDELTVQIHNFYSNAIGGIRLEVKKTDYERAKKILIETGYLNEENTTASNFWSKIDDRINNFTLLNKFRVELRFILLLGMLLSFILFTTIAIISFSHKTPEISANTYLSEYNWCLSHISHKGKKYAPKTVRPKGLLIPFRNGCRENIWFHGDGEIYIPGFGTRIIKGQWRISKETLTIKNLDTLQHIFSGDYQIERSPNKLTLVSDNTTMHCYYGVY